MTMNNEIALMDYDMPQLRQMVQKNTEKINRNELMINQMRKENMEQARKAADREIERALKDKQNT